MNAFIKYWQLWCIAPGDDRRRYKQRVLPQAQDFFEALMTASCDLPTLDLTSKSHQVVQTTLLSQFHSPSERIRGRAEVGLCLRCYLSAPILKSCQRLDNLFSGNKAFSYQDLLPFVLNDDGQQLIVLDADEKSQLILDESDGLQPATFKVFAVDVLRTYKTDSRSSVSLDNWAFLQTKQHQELKKFLAEFGFRPFSDWTLLNRIGQYQLERLFERDRHIVKAFHAVYRRDRRAQKQVSRCSVPSPQQLEEMTQYLAKAQVSVDETELLKSLRRIANQLRAFDIWQSREPLEVKDLETGNYAIRTDLPSKVIDELEIEEQTFLDFLHQQLYIALESAVEQAVEARIVRLKKSKKYAPFATSLLPGLHLYYEEGLSLKEIGSQLKTSSWDQTRRILDPGALLSQARLLTSQQLLETVLNQAQAKGLMTLPAELSYLKLLMEQIEAFVDAKVFSEAVSEIKAGKNRSLDSEYATRLKQYIKQSLS
ncbi:MAG: hypothetical protein WA883_05885 [Phormidesmis sp.]